MITIVRINPEGEIDQTISPADPENFILDIADPQGYILKLAPEGLDIDNSWYSGGWLIRSARPGDYYKWVGGAWVLNESLLDEVIANRAVGLLRESDWTQLDDTPPAKGPWAAYRAQLRAITRGAVTHLSDVIWPTPPS